MKIRIVENMPPPNFQAAAPARPPRNRLFIFSSNIYGIFASTAVLITFSRSSYPDKIAEVA
jgi:hypothetical protein